MRGEPDWSLDRFHAGDRDLFRELVKQLSPRLLSTARSFAESVDGAHDLVQATWTTVWERRWQFRGEGDLSSWIMTVLYRTCLQDQRDRRRRRQLTESMDEDLTPSPPLDPERSLLVAERMRELHAAMAKLSPKELQVALAVFRDGLTSPEAAERLGISASTVRVHVANIRKKLRNHRGES